MDIEIKGKKYPFHVSAAASEKLTKLIAENSEHMRKVLENGEDRLNNEETTYIAMEYTERLADLQLTTLFLGLKHARLARPWYKRLYLIPSKKRLSILLSREDLENIVGEGSLPNDVIETKEENETEKKH